MNECWAPEDFFVRGASLKGHHKEKKDPHIVKKVLIRRKKASHMEKKRPPNGEFFSVSGGQAPKRTPIDVYKTDC